MYRAIKHTNTSLIGAQDIMLSTLALLVRLLQTKLVQPKKIKIKNKTV